MCKIALWLNVFILKMKKYIYSKLLLSILPVLFIPISACYEGNTNEKQSDEIQNSFPTTPLLALTGFGVNTENINLQELKTNYCSGKVYVLNSCKTLADQFFGCQNTKIINTLDEFIPLAKNNVLITDINQMSNQFKALKIDGYSFFGDFEKYPFIASSDSKEIFNYKNSITKFTLTGVTAITRNLGTVADEQGVDFIIGGIKDHFKNSDLVHISNEVSFLEGCTFVNGFATKFCSKKEHFKALTELSCDIVELTGNHNRDYNDASFIETYQWYHQNGMQTFGGGLSPEGANEPLVVQLKDGKKLGFIGFNELCPLAECAVLPNQPGANAYNKEKAYQVIQKMRNELKVDFIFASVQFGEIDSYGPSVSQARITKELIDFGADFVYGSQAHQIQQVEFYKGKSIFHGLGNFLFDQIHRIGVRQAFFLHLYFYNGKLIQTVPVFTYMPDNRQQRVATEAEANEMKKVVYLDNKLYK